MAPKRFTLGDAIILVVLSFIAGACLGPFFVN